MDCDAIAATTAAAAAPPQHLNKQGFRFHKSGSVSPIPPPPPPSSLTTTTTTTTPALSQPSQQHHMPYPQQAPSLERIPSHPTLISELSSSSSHSSSTVFIGGGDIAPSGVDPKLYQIVKRITSYTPSLLISSSSSSGTMQQSCITLPNLLLLLQHQSSHMPIIAFTN